MSIAVGCSRCGWDDEATDLPAAVWAGTQHRCPPGTRRPRPPQPVAELVPVLELPAPVRRRSHERLFEDPPAPWCVIQEDVAFLARHGADLPEIAARLGTTAGALTARYAFHGVPLPAPLALTLESV